MSDAFTAPASAYEINLLEPAECRLERETGGDRLRLHAADAMCWLDVRVARSRPLTHPDEYIAVRDNKDTEIGIFRSLEGFDDDSRALLADALDRVYLLPRVEKVIGVKEQSGLVLWDIDTDRGHRVFAVRNIRDNSVALTNRRVLVTDVDGNRYDFRDIYALGRPAGNVLQKVL